MRTEPVGRPLRAALLVACVASSLGAQSPPPRAASVRAAALGITAEVLGRDVAALAADELRGRLTPSPGLDSARALVARRLATLGLRPMGDDGSYFQFYTVRSETLDTAGTAVQVDSSRWAYGTGIVVTSFLRGGRIAGPVVYVGRGARVPALGLDPYADVDVRGAWLLVHSGLPWPAGIPPAALGTAGRDYTTVLDEARARGALGIVTLPTPAIRNGWDRTRARTVVGRDLDPPRGRAYAAYPLPRISIAEPVLEALLVGTGHTAADLLAADSATAVPPSFRAGELVVELPTAVEHFRAANVVALSEGSDATVRDEWVAIVSHLDGAVGRGVTPEGDSIYNAADDNASGSAGHLAVVEALARGPRPRRPILHVWDSGEEVGLWGTRHLAYGPLGGRLVAMLNVDMIGGTKAPGTELPGEEELAGPGEVFISGPGPLSSVLAAHVSRALAEDGFVRARTDFDTPASQFFYPRTDASPFLENGIPVVQFFTGLHPRYHRQTDEVRFLDLAKMEAVARQVYVTAWRIADGTARPQWDGIVPATLWFVTPRR